MNTIAVSVTKCRIPFKHTYRVPERYEELTTQQYIAAAEHILLNNKAAVFCIASKMDLGIFQALGEDTHQIELMQMMHWIDELPTIPLIKEINVGGTVLYAPPAKLEPITMRQLAYADQAFMNLSSGQGSVIANLALLTACIYRKDPVIPFTIKEADDMAKQLERIDTRILAGVLLFYRACRIYIVSSYKAVFEPPMPEDPEVVAAAVPEGPSFGFFSLLNAISKTGQYGSYEQTCQTDAHEIFFNRIIDLKEEDDKPAKP